MPRKLNRRDLFQTGALATAGLPLAAGTEPAAADESTLATIRADYIVVGAGFAGLAAAWALHKKGKRVLVFEANDRIGGRVWTRHLSDGTPFEIGGQWVSDEEAQPAIRELMKEFNLGVYPQYTTGNNVFVAQDGTLGTYDESNPDPLQALPPISDSAKLELGAMVAALGLMAAVVSRDAPWTPAQFPEELPVLGPRNTTEADQMTIQTFFDLNFTDATAKKLLSVGVAGTFGLEIGAVSLLHLLWVLNTFNNSFLNMSGSGTNQAEHFRIAGKGGVMQVARAIVARLPRGSVRLGFPVRSIRQDGSGVTVTTDVNTARARRVIVAVPGCLASFLQFQPILPPGRAMLQQRVPQGILWKIWLVYDTAFWRAKGLTGQTVSIRDGDFVPNTRDGGKAEGKDSPGLLICFVAGNKAMEFAEMTRAQRRARVLSEVAYRLGAEANQLSTKIKFPAVPPQNPRADNYFEFNWALEEFARGDFAATPGPGVLTGEGFGPAIREPVGRIHWAGVDTSTYPYQTFSGAVQSGKRAAQEVLLLG